MLLVRVHQLDRALQTLVLQPLVFELKINGLLELGPLFWPDATDPALWDARDAFLLGDALLVAPVLEEGARTRRVTLPAGTWHEWPGERVLSGPGQIVARRLRWSALRCSSAREASCRWSKRVTAQ